MFCPTCLDCLALPEKKGNGMYYHQVKLGYIWWQFSGSLLLIPGHSEIKLHLHNPDKADYLGIWLWNKVNNKEICHFFTYLLIFYFTWLYSDKLQSLFEKLALEISFPSIHVPKHKAKQREKGGVEDCELHFMSSFSLHNTVSQIGI